MTISLKFSYIIIILLSHIRTGKVLRYILGHCWQLLIDRFFTGTAMYCYFCNTRDHVGCDSISFGQNDTFLKECEGPCSTVKGQWGYPFSKTKNVDMFVKCLWISNFTGRKVMLWRGCSKISFCSQTTSMCCHCTKDFCNYANECYSSGNDAWLPGRFIFFTQVLIFANVLYCFFWGHM